MFQRSVQGNQAVVFLRVMEGTRAAGEFLGDLHREAHRRGDIGFVAGPRAAQPGTTLMAEIATPTVGARVATDGCRMLFR